MLGIFRHLCGVSMHLATVLLLASGNDHSLKYCYWYLTSQSKLGVTCTATYRGNVENHWKLI